MSRVGNAPIPVPKDSTVTISDRHVVVGGPKGERSLLLPKGISLVRDGDNLKVILEEGEKQAGALQGLTRAQLANHIIGVTKGWGKSLELAGVGYRATMNGSDLSLAVGYSHPIVVIPPQGITFSVVEGKIVISGIDKQLVGQVAAQIRAMKEPEPYKGKGIKYVGEKIRKKAGKSAKAVGGAGGAK